jgi:hypothetical protein
MLTLESIDLEKNCSKMLFNIRFRSNSHFKQTESGINCVLGPFKRALNYSVWVRK